MNRRTFIITAATTVAAAAIGSASVSTSAAQPEPESAPGFDSATVRRGSLSSDREFNAAVSYGDPWMITTAATGTVTDAHPVGTIVGFGDSIVRVDDRPVTLARGTMPMYRALYKGDTEGRDVTQLQAFLLSEGFDAGGRLEIDGEFGGNTEKAVKAWQDAAGWPDTGRVDNAQLVFEPQPVRINAATRVGASFAGAEVTGAEPKVLVDTSTRDRSALPVGTEAEIDVNGTVLTGTVTAQEQVTTADGGRVWRTTVVSPEELPVGTAAKVTVTQTIAEDVLLVPVAALLALSEGGFAVEILEGASTRLVRVEVGEVLDGQAEVSGGISEGNRVVVAT